MKPSKIPYIFVAFFIVIFSVDIFYIYLSNKTWRGVVTENSYQKGLNYNETLKQADQQKKLGWLVEIKYNKISQNKGNLLIKLQDKKSLLQDVSIHVDFKRPIQEGYDFSQDILFKNGTYQAEVNFPLLGQWNAEFTITRNGDIYKETKRLIIQ